MPIRISDLSVGKRKLSLKFGEQSLNLTYDPNRITAKTEVEEAELRDTGRVQGVMADRLARIVVDWDLLDDDGNKLPPSRDVFEDVLGYPVIVYLNSEILNDFFQNPLDGLRSPST